MGLCRRRAGQRRTDWAREAGILVSVPAIDGVVELDADLFAAFRVAEAVDDLGFGAGAFAFAAEEGGAVAAYADRPGFFVPGLVGVFAAQPDGDGGNGALAAADLVAEM